MPKMKFSRGRLRTSATVRNVWGMRAVRDGASCRTSPGENRVMAAGAKFGIRPCGLGARNTLRLEAGMPLYGHEISATINPLESGHDHWLKLDKSEFIGREALL